MERPIDRKEKRSEIIDTDGENERGKRKWIQKRKRNSRRVYERGKGKRA